MVEVNSQYRKEKGNVTLDNSEKEIFLLIVDNPGVSTLDLADICSLSFDILILKLKSLMQKGRITSQLTEDGEKAQWYSTVEEV
ncbi:MAG: hypothetical protein HXS46_19165 [Theionarchaea archaeon]|nr:hypothetical protein [Theionarchaea archaeon]